MVDAEIFWDLDDPDGNVQHIAETASLSMKSRKPWPIPKA
jgi:hypothetical protein